MTEFTVTGSNSRTYYIHTHPQHSHYEIEGEPNLCIFCLPEMEVPAVHFVQDDRGWLVPFCERHYWDSREARESE